MRKFANLTAELMTRTRGPNKRYAYWCQVEKLENYDGTKGRDVDTWLFQVREYLDLTMIPERGHVPYATSLVQRNATLWWRELCEGNNRPTTWIKFYHLLREQFRPKSYNHHGRDELVKIRQYNRESVANFVFRFQATYQKIADLAEANKLDMRWCLM